MDKIRLLLRSVYLKGHQDGNLKTADMSWEDKIVGDIVEEVLARLPTHINNELLKNFKIDRPERAMCTQIGWNDCLARVIAAIKGMEEK